MKPYKLPDLFNWATDSGFSAEDLVSDLLGFYRAVRPVNYFTKLKLISKSDALKRWDYYGPIGKYKNKNFKPLLFPDPVKYNSARPEYGMLPSFMTAISPYSDFKSGNVKVIIDNGRKINVGVQPGR